jgi:hypothetical protein
MLEGITEQSLCFYGLQALFAIGLHMGDSLDVGWNLLMDTFQQLDRIISTPHKLPLQSPQTVCVEIFMRMTYFVGVYCKP